MVLKNTKPDVEDYQRVFAGVAVDVYDGTNQELGVRSRHIEPC